MKRSLAILFAILSLSIFFNFEIDQASAYSDYVAEQPVDNGAEHTLSQGDYHLTLSGCSGGTSSNVTVVKVVTNNTASRRSMLDLFSGVRIAVANLYSECSYSYSCGFPFEHQPQRELFFILRNIRI